METPASDTATKYKNTDVTTIFIFADVQRIRVKLKWLVLMSNVFIGKSYLESKVFNGISSNIRIEIDIFVYGK